MNFNEVDVLEGRYKIIDEIFKNLKYCYMEIQIERKKGGYLRGFEVKESYFRYPKNKILDKLSCHDIKYIFISDYLCNNEVASELLDDYRKMFYLNEIMEGRLIAIISRDKNDKMSTDEKHFPITEDEYITIKSFIDKSTVSRDLNILKKLTNLQNSWSQSKKQD
jgi:hypothetical protein